ERGQYPGRMRASIVLLMLAAIVAGSASALTAPSSGTSLRITYWEDSARPLDGVTWTLRCNPAGGTLQRPARACTRLLAGGVKLFAPTPKDAVCTEIYGGPQKTRVTGTVRGQPVWTTFSRTNG